MSTSSYVDISTNAVEHCESMSSTHPDLATHYSTISSLFTRKLWHQLTVTILEFVSTPQTTLRLTSAGGNSYLSLYDRVVLACDKKLNQLTYCRIATAVAESLARDGGDYVAARAVLEGLLEKKTRLGPLAALYAESRLALLHLTRLEGGNTVEGEDQASTLKGIEEMLKRGEAILTESAGVDAASSDATVVHSSFYEASAAYRKFMNEPAAFYRQALLYLNYTPLSNLSLERRRQIAVDVSLAALAGEGVYHFGDVIVNCAPALESLEGTENSWLMDLLRVMADGNVAGFQKLAEERAKEISALPALVSRAELVKEKITLLALVNMVFERPSAERTLYFKDVAVRTGVELDKVEWVIMRALSLGLIKGNMDQVDATVTVSWVMPRVLDNNQLKALASRFSDWAVKVSKTKDYVGEQNPVFS